MELKGTKHFTVNEILRSQTALQLGIDNTPKDDKTIENLNYTLERLEEIREAYGEPIIITSGYRCPELNAAVGGASNSQHRKGEAVDIVWDIDLIYFIMEHFKFDQMIREKKGNTKWIHLSSRKENQRGQTFSIVK